MRFRQVYCCICGVPIRRLRDADTRRHEGDAFNSPGADWLRDSVFIYDAVFPVSTSDFPNPRKIQIEDLKIGRFPGSRPEPGTIDPDTNEFIPKNISIFRPEFGADRRRSNGYPLHKSCWGLLRSQLGAISGSLDERTVHTTLYDILENTMFAKSKLRWPHGDYGVSAYQHNISWSLPAELPFLHDNPAEDISQIISAQEIHALSQKPVLIPDFLPLPTEIQLAVLKHLSSSDIDALQQIPSNRKIECPDIWKSLISPTGEFGYTDGAHIPELRTQHSWYALCQAARYHCGPAGKLQNRYRIWKICKSLADAVIDIVRSQQANMHVRAAVRGNPNFCAPPEMERPDTFTVQAERHAWFSRSSQLSCATVVKYSTETDSVIVDSMVIYYAGSGDLRYVSGLELLPAGDKIGYLTGRTRRVAVTDTRFVHTAVSIFGLVDIAFSKTKGDVVWFGGCQPARASDTIAISRRILQQSEIGGHEIKIDAKLDESKISYLRLTMPEIIPTTALSEPENFVQSRPWSPYPPDTRGPFTRASRISERYWGYYENFHVNNVISLQGRALKRITAWALPERWSSPFDLCGLTAHFEDPNANPPMTIGDCSGVAIDFFVSGNAGEHLVSVELLSPARYWGNYTLRGIRMATNWGRIGHFTGRTTSQELFESTPILASTNRSIVGLFGNGRMEPHSKRLPLLGVLSISNSPDGNEPRDKFPVIQDAGVEESECGSWAPMEEARGKRPDGVADSVQDGDTQIPTKTRAPYEVLHFASNMPRTTAIMNGTGYTTLALLPTDYSITVTCYSTLSPRPRLTGLVFSFTPKRARPDENPKPWDQKLSQSHLGQIGNSQALVPLILDDSERLVSIEWCTDSPPTEALKNGVATSLTLLTSHGRSISWTPAGNPIVATAELPPSFLIGMMGGILLLKPDSILRWTFTNNSDHLTIHNRKLIFPAADDSLPVLQSVPQPEDPPEDSSEHAPASKPYKRKIFGSLKMLPNKALCGLVK
ncbi:hypothetical protein Dda_6739 [Drechslerella dactyloides]|uniref:F-box domain-containing protein n=1 Tax=Drechslerella dactyloides TaxID=74499 RepID=A0AAD6IW57_DREDA|nr:hypothetical protein Dda_6739 [Drechslerella dactyloides]